MSDPFAQGMAAIFADTAFTVAAVYASTDGSAPLNLRVRLMRGNFQVAGHLDVKTNADQITADALQADIPVRPPRGSGLLIGTDQYTIESASPDHQGARWHMVLARG